MIGPMTKQHFDVSALQKAYARNRPGLEHALQRVHALATEVASVANKWQLARIRLTEARVKSVESLERKARKNHWDPSGAVNQADDTVGVRLVCNNVCDVYGIVELLKERITSGFVDDGPPPEVLDYVKNPTPDGYRAVHVRFRVDTMSQKSFEFFRVGCEIQVRTLLQDAWAILSHSDIYKNAGLSDDLCDRFVDLARVIEVADQTADKIRDRIMVLRPPPPQRPDLSQITDDGLAFLFATVFGQPPEEHTIQRLRDNLLEVGLASLTDVEAVLTNAEFREGVRRAYSEGFPHSVVMSPHRVFLLTPVAAAHGIGAAIAKARREGAQDWDEIDAIGRREAGEALPDTADEFVLGLLEDELNIGTAAEQFGAARRCTVCSEEFVDPEAFEEGAATYYDIDGFNDEIVNYLHDSGVTGSVDHSGLCSYHGYVFDKDD